MMQEDKYTDFDLQIRSMLQDAEEEVPSRVWEAVSGRIDRKKVIGLWWRRTAAGVAVAAAVALGVFFASDRSSAPEPGAPLTAEAGSVEIVNESSEFVADAAETVRPAAVRRTVTEKTSQEAVIPSEPSSDEIVPEEVIPDVEATSESEEKAVDEEEYRDDPFARMAYEDSRKASWKNSVSGFVQGNVTSNERSLKASRHFGAPSANVPTKTGVNDEKSISTYGVPISFGIGAKYRFAERWSVSAALNYTLLSRSFTGTYSEVTGGKVTKSVTADVANNLHYIGIPVNVYYDVLESNKVSFYAFGGFSVEKGIVNKFRIDSYPTVYYSESVPGVQLSSALGLGLEFMLNDYLALYIDPSARYYFDCDQPTSVRTQKQFMMNLEVGLRFNI